MLENTLLDLQQFRILRVLYEVRRLKYFSIVLKVSTVTMNMPKHKVMTRPIVFDFTKFDCQVI